MVQDCPKSAQDLPKRPQARLQRCLLPKHPNLCQQIWVPEGFFQNTQTYTSKFGFPRTSFKIGGSTPSLLSSFLGPSPGKQMLFYHVFILCLFFFIVFSRFFARVHLSPAIRSSWRAGRAPRRSRRAHSMRADLGVL